MALQWALLGFTGFRRNVLGLAAFLGLLTTNVCVIGRRVKDVARRGFCLPTVDRFAVSTIFLCLSFQRFDKKK